jgi:hypothetical protein
MYTLKVNSVNEGLSESLRMLKMYGKRESSRNGPVLAMQTPVGITNHYPMNNVLLSPMRNANPFFHYFEAIWMLAGHNDIAWVARFNKRMAEYSDDGVTQRGAYGYRWRRFFRVDQIDHVIRQLREDPKSRRAMLQMWGIDDLVTRTTRDKPCNTHIYFRIVDDCLDATVCNRSNDVLWGLWGANCVHFSFLLEYIASALCVTVGKLHTVTNNLHLYTDIVPEDRIDELVLDLEQNDIYKTESRTLDRVGGLGVYRFFMPEAEMFLANPIQVYNYNNVLVRDAQHMYLAWSAMKRDWQCIQLQNDFCTEIKNVYWRAACQDWLQRRYTKRQSIGVRHVVGSGG